MENGWRRKDEDAPSASEAMSSPSGVPSVLLGIFGYAFCSSTLLLVNKLAVTAVPAPSFVLACQFAATAGGVWVVDRCCASLEIEALKWDRVKAFSWVVIAFCACLFANTKALQLLKVETVIVFRSCSPLLVSALDFLCLGRQLPSCSSLLALLGVAGGAYLYAIAEQGMKGNHFQQSADVFEGLEWGVGYLVAIVVEMALVKYILETVKMNTWTRVYYNNLLSIPLLGSIGILNGEMELLRSFQWDQQAVSTVFVSCVIGVGMSYSGFHLRQLVSATTFTVVGVGCKLVTLFLSHLTWDRSTSFQAYCGLLICILSASSYRQADFRKSYLERKNREGQGDIEMGKVSGRQTVSQLPPIQEEDSGDEEEFDCVQSPSKEMKE